MAVGWAFVNIYLLTNMHMYISMCPFDQYLYLCKYFGRYNNYQHEKNEGCITISNELQTDFKQVTWKERERITAYFGVSLSWAENSKNCSNNCMWLLCAIVTIIKDVVISHFLHVVNSVMTVHS